MNKGRKANELEDKSKWPQPYLRLVHPKTEMKSPGTRKRQAQHNNDKFEQEYGKNFMPKGP